MRITIPRKGDSVKWHDCNKEDNSCTKQIGVKLVSSDTETLSCK